MVCGGILESSSARVLFVPLTELRFGPVLAVKLADMKWPRGSHAAIKDGCGVVHVFGGYQAHKKAERYNH
jgi:hypothetical protein